MNNVAEVEKSLRELTVNLLSGVSKESGWRCKSTTSGTIRSSLNLRSSDSSWMTIEVAHNRRLPQPIVSITTDQIGITVKISSGDGTYELLQNLFINYGNPIKCWSSLL